MPRREGLRRKIAVRMALVTLCGLAIAAVVAFLVYNWVFTNHPDAVAAPGQWVPHPVDWLIIAGVVLAAMGIAVAAGVQLARRIVFPLVSLADSARRVAEGDLTARAEVDDRSLAETANLVDDFNRMVARLEAQADGMIRWNASIAHELRTPVTILRGRLQGVADGVFEMDERTLTSLLRQVDGLGRLVEDLRVVSLADSGHLELRTETADLAQVVGELREAVGPELADAGFTVDWRLAQTVLDCDPTRLRQAVLALIENARRHATPGPLTVRTDVDGPMARIAVEDSGPGVAPDLADTLFEAFRRNPEKASGSGLGLAVVRAIAERHEGRARYERSALGGSRFVIELPPRAEPYS